MEHADRVPLQALVHAQPLCAAHVAWAENVVHVDGTPEQVDVAAFQVHPDCAMQAGCARKL